MLAGYGCDVLSAYINNRTFICISVSYENCLDHPPQHIECVFAEYFFEAEEEDPLSRTFSMEKSFFFLLCSSHCIPAERTISTSYRSLFPQRMAK